MLQNFHAVVSSVVERQGLAVAARVVVGTVVPSAAAIVVVVVEVAVVEAAVVRNKQLNKISKCIIIDYVNNIICQT